MILEAIFNGEFYPSETVIPKSEKYRNALRACEKIMVSPSPKNGQKTG